MTAQPHIVLSDYLAGRFTSANQFDTDLDISSDEDSDSEAKMPARPSKRPTNKRKVEV